MYYIITQLQTIVKIWIDWIDRSIFRMGGGGGQVSIFDLFGALRAQICNKKMKIVYF